jgi:hypothetical protein
MTRQILFGALLLATCLYAAARGGWPERIAAATLLFGAALTVVIAPPFETRFSSVEPAIFLVDALLLGMFLWLSIRSTRFWPLWIAGILGAETLIHIMRATVPAVVPIAYMDAQALWGWLVQVILLVGTRRHQLRLDREGADAPWKT